MIKINSDIRILHYEEIDSTNNEAKRLYDNQKDLPFWIIADKQTSGKGRKNRFWDSPVGNFMGTFVLSIKGEKRILPQLSFVTALAIYYSILEYKPKENNSKVMLKWPNDIIINNRKCGGILIENLFSQNNLSHTIAIGIGINLKISPTQSTFPSSSIMKEFDIDIERADFLNVVNINMMDLINIWSSGENFKEILNSWRLKAYLINKEISVSLPNGGKTSGIFSSIDEEGGLILTNNDGKKNVFYAAEIFEGL